MTYQSYYIKISFIFYISSSEHDWRNDPRNMDINFNESYVEPDFQEALKRSIQDK